MISLRFIRLFRVAELVFASAFIAPAVFAQSISARDTQAPTVDVSSFNGSWTYRSFVSDPNLATPPDALLFGAGTLQLTITGQQVSGTLGGSGWQLNLTGSVAAGTPASIRFQGTGTINGETWVYDYLGYAVPSWPNGVNQRPAIVGSIIRTVPHSGGQAAAGVVAQWIAVRTDANVPVPLDKLTPNNLRRDTGGMGGVQRMSIITPSEGALSPMSMEVATGKEDSLRKLWEDYLAGKPPPSGPQMMRNLPLESAVGALRREIPMANQPPVLQKELFLPENERETLAASSQVKFASPPPARPSTGAEPVKLVVRYCNPEETKIGEDKVKLRTYNGKLVGPTIRCKPGETLRIELRNELDLADPSNNQPHNTLRAFNETNLHFHGLHVSPNGISDNVFLRVLPKTCQFYEVEIPPNHPAGTYWYHAHLHGSVAAQLASGMAGALIVEGGHDERLKVDKEEILLLQQIPYVPDPEQGGIGVVEHKFKDKSFGPPAWDTLERFTTINGLRLPVFTVKPGELVRWRIIDGAIRHPVALSLVRQKERDAGGWPENIPMHEFAVDGLSLGKFRELNAPLVLHPGYRSEVLFIVPSAEAIPAGQTVSYYLVDSRDMKNPGQDTPELGRRYVARLDIVGQAVSPARTLPSVSVLDPRPASIPAAETQGNPERTMHYSIGNGFKINNQPYDENHWLEPKPRLNTAEHWTLTGTQTPHPFHIHVNPFEIYSIIRRDPASGVETELLTEPVWRDTVAIEANETIRFRTRYKKFPGKFVQHCHILDHEDQGMMMNVEIVGDNPSPPPPGGGGLLPLNFIPAPAGGLPTELRSLTTPAGAPMIVSIVQSVDCMACRELMSALQTEAAKSGWPRTVVVAPDSPERVADYRRLNPASIPVIADPGQQVLRHFLPRAEGGTHATFLVDKRGSVRWQDVGEEPLQNLALLRQQVNALPPDGDTPPSASVTIDVWETAETTDDYVTWTPTPCTITLNAATGEPVDVVLTNDAPKQPKPNRTRPSDGDVSFDHEFVPGRPLRYDTLPLTLVPGQPVTFYIAGKFDAATNQGRPSSEDKDCVVEVRKESAAGTKLGSHALMVRIRKHVDDLEPEEWKAFFRGMEKLHQGGESSIYERFVKLHGLAARRGGDWPDQAHRGPGFIPWHRTFLLGFERELQKVEPGIALPYWRMDKEAAIFTEELIGGNEVTSSDPFDQMDQIMEVRFTEGHPLAEWYISMPNMSSNDNPKPPLGLLTRNGMNHASRPAISGFATSKDEADVLNYTSFAPFALNHETNPHDLGHGWVGSWMAECQYSPADPVFWVFHCELDRLWAKWQRQHNKFKYTNLVNDDSHFAPLGKFQDAPPGNTIPWGHFLEDTMWPWDGTEGKQTDPRPGRRPWPNDPSFHPFPKATAAKLWPETDTKPTVADMIDYINISGARRPMGFAYDNVGYGTAPPSFPPPAGPMLLAAGPKEVRVLADQTLSTPTAPLPLKLTALRMVIGASDEASRATLLSTAENAAAAPEVQALALTAAAAQRLRGADDIAVQQLSQSRQQHVRVAAVRAIAQLIHLGNEEQGKTKKLEAALAKSLDDTDANVRREALVNLVPMGDAPAVTRLTKMLEQPDAPNPLIPLVTGIRLAGKTKSAPLSAALQRLLSHDQVAVASAAATSLAGDKASVARRLSLAKERQAPSPLRLALLSSLTRDTPEVITLARQIALDGSESIELRARAVTVLRVALHHDLSRKANPAGQSVIRDLEELLSSTTDKILKQSLERNLEILRD